MREDKELEIFEEKFYNIDDNCKIVDIVTRYTFFDPDTHEVVKVKKIHSNKEYEENDN